MFNFKKFTRKHLQKHKKSKLKFVGKNDLSIRTHLYSSFIHKLKPIDEGIKSIRRNLDRTRNNVC